TLRRLQTVFALQGEEIGISRPCADQIDFTQSGRHHLAPSMISYWKVQNLSYPDRTGLQLRLVRHGVPCRGRKVIGSFKKAVLSAPVKRQKARTERDFLRHLACTMTLPRRETTS